MICLARLEFLGVWDMSLSVLDILFVVWRGEGEHEPGKQTQARQRQGPWFSLGIPIPIFVVSVLTQLAAPDPCFCSFFQLLLLPAPCSFAARSGFVLVTFQILVPKICLMMDLLMPWALYLLSFILGHLQEPRALYAPPVLGSKGKSVKHLSLDPLRRPQ